MKEEKKSLRQQDDKVIKHQNNMDQESKNKNMRRLELQREDGYKRYDKRDDVKKAKMKQVEKEKSEIKEKEQAKDQPKDQAKVDQKNSAKEEKNSVNEEKTTTNNNTESLTEDKEAIYIDKLKRLMAEFDNYRKRNEKEKLEIYDRASSNLLTEMLPIVDNFERALEVETEDKTLYEGIHMIYKQLMSTLEKAHIKVIEAEGKPFDPNLHNAILHIEDEKYGENEVVEELQKGYLYKDKVLRYSMVKVAN